MKRIDQLLVEKGHCDSRAHAQRMIKEGRVTLGSYPAKKEIKPSLKVDEETVIDVRRSESDNYVSRGALKLQGAIDHANINIQDVHAIDVGQSTGGFTDYLLQHGASSVLGIEVGHDQLADRLRTDPRVTCLEGYNARTLSNELTRHSPNGRFDLAVMDVSFISQRLILPGLCNLISENAWLITLVKPQFELGPEHIGKGGIVRSEEQYPQLKRQFYRLMDELNMTVEYYIDSPIKGGDGNKEFLLIARKNPHPQ